MTLVKKIIIPYREVIHLVNPADIMFCQSDNYYTHLFLAEGVEFLLIKTLAKLERELESTSFIRVNQSYLVNKFYIKNINKKNKSINLSDNREIPFTLSIKKLMELIIE